MHLSWVGEGWECAERSTDETDACPVIDGCAGAHGMGVREQGTATVAMPNTAQWPHRKSAHSSLRLRWVTYTQPVDFEHLEHQNIPGR
jgi:hypothetical protein